jgi:uncharacterized protein YndB with AHSA1/START domain
MHTDLPQVAISRAFDAPRALVYRAFTEPEHVAAWWGPIGSSMPREEMDFDVRPGGHQRWTELSAADPEVRVRIDIALAEVTDGELLAGVMHVGGRLPLGFEPFATRFRFEFHDEAGDRTRLEIRQWLPDGLATPTEQGWGEAFTKLDNFLRSAGTTPAGG